MRDLPKSLDLLELARRLLLDDILNLVPEARRRDLHLIATTMAIVAREAAAGAGPADEIVEMLSRFYKDASPAPTLPRERGRVGPAAQPWEGEGSDAPNALLLRRFALDLRNGEFETSQSRTHAARAILWRLTILKLREGNPQFLAANGIV